MFEIDSVRKSFPFLRAPDGYAGGEWRSPAYLDSAASAQKPECVIECLRTFLSYEYANIHRGAYALSANATEAFEAARRAVAAFLGAGHEHEVVFTKGSTEGLNLLAHGFASILSPGDTILSTVLEHHSNFVPWQLIAKRHRLNLAFVDINADASLNLDDLKTKIETLRPKVLAFTHVSNAFGSISPLQEIVELARRHQVWTVIDGAQSVPHASVRLAEVGADFIVFSGHKVYGPNGIGAVCGSRELLDRFEPYQGGGEMIEQVSVEGTTWAPVPHKFEAGTPPIAEAIALRSALEFVSALGIDEVAAHEHAMAEYAWEKLSALPGVQCFGPRSSGKAQGPIVPFSVEGVHPHDLSTIADSYGVQIRAGHHCAMPALRRLGLRATARASMGVYVVREDIDRLLEAVQHAQKVFR